MMKILAVLAGAAVTLGIWYGVDAAIFRTGIFPDSVEGMTTGHWLVPLAGRLAGGVAGGWIGMQISQARMTVTFGAGSLAATHAALAVFAASSKSPDLGPVWYPVVVLLAIIPATWLGTKLSKAATPTM